MGVGVLPGWAVIDLGSVGGKDIRVDERGSLATQLSEWIGHLYLAPSPAPINMTKTPRYPISELPLTLPLQPMPRPTRKMKAPRMPRSENVDLDTGLTLYFWRVKALTGKELLKSNNDRIRTAGLHFE